MSRGNYLSGFVVLGVAFSLTLNPVHGSWLRILEENFDSGFSADWSYRGSQNGSGQDLFRHDGVNDRVTAEWDQGNFFDGSGDPYVLTNSRLSRPLGRVLTDQITFRFGTTLRINAGSIPDTFEFYQVANFGLYDLSPDLADADRLQSDNVTGVNSNFVRDANNLVEFNYFINNQAFGFFNPFIQGTLIAEMPVQELDSSLYFVTGTGSDPLFHNTDMGADTYLPTDTNLYVEIVYYGAETNAFARRVYSAIYTEPTRTNLLSVNGVSMYYWTQPTPSNKSFKVDHAAFVNYAGINISEFFGTPTPDGAGAGSYDDLYVDVLVPEGSFAAAQPDPGGQILTWATVPGKNYSIATTTNLLAGPWTTQLVLTATGDFLGYTNALDGARPFVRIEFEPGP